jgi:hypothetical protein
MAAGARGVVTVLRDVEVEVDMVKGRSREKTEFNNLRLRGVVQANIV